MWPRGERRPAWTAFVAYPTAAATPEAPSPTLRVAVAGDNGVMYVWEGLSHDIFKAPAGGAPAPGASAGGQGGNGDGGGVAARCLGAVELPVGVRVAALTRVPSSASSAGACAMCTQGPCGLSSPSLRSRTHSQRLFTHPHCPRHPLTHPLTPTRPTSAFSPAPLSLSLHLCQARDWP